MGIILVALLLSILWVSNAPTREDQKLGRAAFDQQKINQHRAQKDFAAQHDLYYKESQLPTLDVNANFYSDGSLRRDAATGQYYNKGQYYCDSRGLNADCQQAAPGTRRPPQH